MSKKKIIIIHHCGDIGGAGQSLLRTAKMLSSDFDVEILVPKASQMDNYLSENSIKALGYNSFPGKIEYYSGGAKIFSRTFVKNLLKAGPFQKEIYNILLSEKPDFLLLNSLTLSYMVPMVEKLSKTLGKAITCGCFVRETFPKNGSKTVLSQYKNFLEKADITFFISEYDKNFFNLKNTASVVLYNSVSENFFDNLSKEEAFKKLNINYNPDACYVLYLGGASQLKGISVISDAMKKLQRENIILLAAGDEKALMAPYFSHNAEFLGRVSDVRFALAACDFLVFPSTRPHQARPVFEAGAFKKPVIISDFTETREALKDGFNGLCFTPGNIDELAEKILVLSRDNALCAKLGAENYSETLRLHRENVCGNTLKNALINAEYKTFWLTNMPSPYRVDLCNELSKKLDLTVCFERESAGDRDASWFLRKEITFKNIFLNGIKIGADKSLSFKIKKIIKNGHYKNIIIGGYSSPTAMICLNYLKRHKIPYIFSCDGGIVKNSENKLAKKFKTHFIKGAVLYLSTSDSTDKYLLSYGAEKDGLRRYPFTSISEKDIIEKPLGSDEKNKLRVKLGLPVDLPIILSVGSFIPRKGFDLLLKATKAFNGDVQVVIIGGVPTGEYIGIVNDSGLKNVTFLEFMGEKELRDYYLAADLFVFPTREDIWGLVVNEALACGLPVISTENCVSAITMIENGRNGEIIPVNNITAIEMAVNNWLKLSAGEKMLLSQNAILSVKEYTFEKAADKISGQIRN